MTSVIPVDILQKYLKRKHEILVGSIGKAIKDSDREVWMLAGKIAAYEEMQNITSTLEALYEEELKPFG
jgi:hypothetical protein